MQFARNVDVFVHVNPFQVFPTKNIAVYCLKLNSCYFSVFDGKYLPNMNTFCEWFSETKVISVYDSFFRLIISNLDTIAIVCLYCHDQTITKPVHIDKYQVPTLFRLSISDLKGKLGRKRRNS
jgi:hypothetical protein